MKGLIVAVLALAAASFSPASADTSEPLSDEGMLAVKAIDVVALVLGVDPVQRTMTLKGPDGALLTIEVPPELPADPIRPGALLDVRYVEPEALTIGKPGVPPDELVLSVRIAPQIGSRAALTAKPRRVVAKVLLVDRPRRALTLLGPGDSPIVLKVSPSVEGYDELKSGDVIVIEYTNAVALSAVQHGSADGSVKSEQRKM